jgi:hypothetical protein
MINRVKSIACLVAIANAIIPALLQIELPTAGMKTFRRKRTDVLF